MKYYVTIGTRSHEVVVDGDTVTLDGRVAQARIESVPGTPFQLLRVGDEVHRVIARRVSRYAYDLALDGYRFGVEALDERARTIRDLSGTATKPSGPAPLVAPMPGLIVRVNVSEGDQVRAGQGLVVMEAMKMENELRASAAGTVRKVLVAHGSAVEKGALLLEME